MHNELLDFVAEMITNPRQQLAYATAPSVVMERFGLSADAQAALNSGNPAHLVQIFTMSDFQPCDIFVDPGPDPLIDPDTPPTPASDQQPQLN